VHPIGDLPVGQPLGEKVEDLELLAGEGTGPVILIGVTQPVQNPGGDGRVQQRLPRRHPADAVEQLVTPDLLEHVASGTGHDAVDQGLIVGERRQHQAAHVGVGGADVAGHLYTRVLSQADVEHRHVGFAQCDPGQGLLTRRRLADHRHVVLVIDQVADTPTHHFVVVGQEHSDGHDRHCGLRSRR